MNATTNSSEWETKLGKRGSAQHSADMHRNALRAWVQAMTGASFRQVMGLGTKAMSAAYNDTTDARLNAWSWQVKAGAASLDSSAVTVAAPLTLEPATPAPASAALSSVNGQAGAVAQAIAAALSSFKPGVQEEEVRRIAAEEASKATATLPQQVTVIREGGPAPVAKNVGVQHRLFPIALRVVAADIPLALVGPAGSGKTTAMEAVAEALGRDFYLTGACVMPSSIVGFADAGGRPVETAFTRAYKNGGVHVFDEMDGYQPAALLAANAALANGYASFPDGMHKRHDKFVPVANMNTWGRGADRQYVGRAQQDGAAMSRWAMLGWDYDEAFEAALIGAKGPAQEPVNPEDGGILSPDKWAERVRAVRAAVAAQSVRHLVTPRATIYGARLFAAGLGRKWVEEMVLWQGLDSEQRARVERVAGGL